jgi:hypothetical protein
MAFLRFNRDKRGYEHFYLVEPTTNRRGKIKPRVLYWFRTPPGVRVGREPFDEGVRRALEAQNPGVTFDWRSIVDAPIPSADADKWRERRRAERAAKQVARADAAETAEAADLGDADEAETDARDDGVSGDESASAQTNESTGVDEITADGSADAEPGSGAEAASSSNRGQADAVDPARKRRRRHRGRRPGAPAGAADPAGAAGPGGLADPSVATPSEPLEAEAGNFHDTTESSSD